MDCFGDELYPRRKSPNYRLSLGKGFTFMQKPVKWLKFPHYAYTRALFQYGIRCRAAFYRLHSCQAILLHRLCVHVCNKILTTELLHSVYRIYRTAVKLYNLNRCVIYDAAWNCWWKWNSRTVYVKKKAVAREKPMHAWQCTMHGLESMSKETRHPYISTNEIPPFVKVLCVLIILLKSESPRADVVCSYIYHVFVSV